MASLPALKFSSGRYEQLQVASAPAEVLDLLKTAKGSLTDAQVADIFGTLHADVINFEDMPEAVRGFVAAATSEKFAQLLGKSMDTSALLFRNAKKILHFSLTSCVVTPLTENLSVSLVDLSSCDLTVSDALMIADNVIPWNRTVTSWNFQDNPQLGSEGVATLVKAMVDSGNVQRINMANTNASNLVEVVATLQKLPSLFQVDVSANPSFEAASPQLSQLNAVLQRNLRLLHPPAAGTEWAHSDCSVVAAPPVVEPSAAASAPKPADKKPDEKPARHRAVSVAKPDSRPRAQSTSRVAASPAKAAPAPAETKREGSNPPAAAKADAPKADDPAASPAPKPQPTRERSTTQPLERQPSAARSVTTTARHNSPTPRLRQAPLDDGVEEWRRVQQHYNSYIRAGSPARRDSSPEEKKIAEKQRDAGLHPKFIFGKRVDQVWHNPYPQFARPLRGIERAASPREIRRFAPWLSETGTSTPGTATRVPVEGEKQPVFLKIVDGGHVTHLNDDPREIGYQSRKLQEGQFAARPTPAFSSAVAREVRWAVGPHLQGYVTPRSNAPDPGAYTVESDWDRNARKLRDARRSQSASGRPMFGASAAARTRDLPKSDMPGPGQYEIP